MAKGKVKELEAVAPEVETKEAEAPQPNALLITVELANALIEHLARGSYSEVSELINALRQSRTVTIEEKKEE